MFAAPAIQPDWVKLSKLERYSLLPSRLWLFAAIVGMEYFPLVLFPHPWMLFKQLMAPPIIFGASLIFFGRHRFSKWPSQALGRSDSEFDVRFFNLHLFALASVALLEWLLLRVAAATDPAIPVHAPTLVVLWYGSIALLVASLLPALFPGNSLKRFYRSFGMAWVYAVSITCAVVLLGKYSQWLWDVPSVWLGHDLQRITFSGVNRLLSLFYANTLSNPLASEVGTAKFQVRITGVCSGIEGLALMLVLTSGWLIYERKNLKLQRAICLVPISLVIVLILNVIRITTLIAIGDAGHEDVAIHGFHSESGWILFNIAAFAFLLAANRMRWLHQENCLETYPPQAPAKNEAVIYLLPFVASLAASMVGRAATSSFDWLYPLRFIVAVAVLFWFRAEYRRLDWRFGWLGPASGVAVFALWLGISRWQPHASETGLRDQLAHLSSGTRTAWIAVRATSAVVTVPIVEELAFRGYIARRITSADVDSLPFNRLTLWGIVASSLLFGAMHGSMWIAGTIAGLVFAYVAKRKDRIGEAVAAHATANLLIAIWVLASGDFSMW